jgi:membrane protease YdiL (CAAX protease family)
MKYIFLDDNGRLRSGWRTAVFLITFILLGGVFIFAATVLLAGLPIGPSIGSYLPITIPFAISAIVALVLGWVYGKVFERLPFSSLGISLRGKWFVNFAAGLLLGGVGLCCALIVAVMSGGLKLAVNHDSSSAAIWSTLSVTFLVFAIGALSEETLFRGYPLQTLVRSDQVIAGIAVTSLLFALGHTNNPDAGAISLINTLIAGVWFAAAYLKTRDIWFPFGMHLMWNWLQGPVFGINVSGIADLSPDPVLRATDAGPAWLTGGNYGIEGGLACTFAILLSIGLVWLLPWPAAKTKTP